MSSKLLIEWRHDLCAEIAKKRYINDQEMLRVAHAEIVNLFFPQETSDESDEINSETSEKSGELKTNFPSQSMKQESKRLKLKSSKFNFENCKSIKKPFI
jgi:hypothetical protein